MSTDVRRSSPLLPTYPTSQVVWAKISRWYDRFHCQLCGVFAACSRPAFGTPRVVPKHPHGSTFVSRVLRPVTVLMNGGLLPMFRPGLRRSRRKNSPTPARMADLPSPLISQATPTRGAKLFLSWGTNDRFDATTPPSRPASLHQFVPAGSSSPLQGSVPSAG